MSPSPLVSSTPLISNNSPTAIPTTVSPTEAPKFDINKEYNVSMETTLGTIKIKLYPKVAPKTVENFVTLINQHYYDGIIFHRVIDNFVIQGGDPTGLGNGGQSSFGHAFEDEFSENVKFDKVGLLAMANSGVNTNASQFFITLSVAQTSQLYKRHTIFGEVTQGFDVVQAIGRTKVGQDDKPLVDVKMTKVTIL
ncbi:MAG: peptidylprolyl isomerase [Candidatus Sericytochromatia bacterium]|nr:peptidylprolyl isomerase [Candidatus Sericytochromatia bacterium]